MATAATNGKKDSAENSQKKERHILDSLFTKESPGYASEWANAM